MGKFLFYVSHTSFKCSISKALLFFQIGNCTLGKTIVRYSRRAHLYIPWVSRVAMVTDVSTSTARFVLCTCIYSIVFNIPSQTTSVFIMDSYTTPMLPKTTYRLYGSLIATSHVMLDVNSNQPRDKYCITKSCCNNACQGQSCRFKGEHCRLP